MATVSISVSKTDETTTGASDGTISFVLTTDTPGGTFNYSITKSGVVTTHSTTDEFYTFGGLEPGVYDCLAAQGFDISNAVRIAVATAVPIPPDPGPDPEPPIVYTYSTNYNGSFCDKSGNNIFIEFKKRRPEGGVIPLNIGIQFAGEDDSPVVIDYPDNGEYKLTPVNGSQCEIKIKAEDGNGFELSSMYTADEKEWMVVISGAWNWTGFLIPDSCIEPFASKPYDVSVRATDALGTLKDVPFQRDDLTKYKGYYSDKEIIRLCLAKTGLELRMLVGVNTYEALMEVDNNRSPMGQSYANTEPFLNDDGTAMDCYAVMESVLRRWSARLHQFNGVWQIVNVMEKSVGDVFAYRFNIDGFHDSPDVTLGNAITAGGQDRALRPVGDTSFAKAFKQSAAYYKYGYISNALFNGDFDIWTSKPTGLPDGWSMNGGTTGTTKIRTQDGYPTSDYYVEIGLDGTGGLVHDTPVQIRQYDFPTITFDLFAIDSVTFGGFAGRYVSVYISNNDGLWFTEDGWKNSYRPYVIKKDVFDFLKQLRFEIQVDPLDTDYLMDINILAVGLADGTHFKTNINNINISAGFGTGREKNGIGETNLQVQLAKQTFIPDPIEVLHSDDSNVTRTSGLLIASDQDERLNDPSDGVPSSVWTRAGIDEFAPLLRIVANTEIRLHQRPYRILEFEYYGYGLIDINTLLTVDLLDGTFIFLSGSFDLKRSVPRLKFAQVLTELVIVNETLKMDYGGR